MERGLGWLNGSHTGVSLLDVMQTMRPNVVILNPNYDLFLNLTKQFLWLNQTLFDNVNNIPEVIICHLLTQEASF